MSYSVRIEAMEGRKKPAVRAAGVGNVMYEVRDGSGTAYATYLHERQKSMLYLMNL